MCSFTLMNMAIDSTANLESTLHSLHLSPIDFIHLSVLSLPLYNYDIALDGRSISNY